MGSNRDEFSRDTIDRAAKRVGYRCSCPDCRIATVGPSDENDGKISSIGEAAHICAAAPGGPRYDQNMSSEERKSISNCIWLCKTHARLIDTDTTRYTVELLHEWKESAEAYASAELGHDTRSTTTSGTQALTDIPAAVDLIGRKDDVNEIKEKLKRHNIVCITAAGGVGKSAIAAVICNDYKCASRGKGSQFKYVAWITSTGMLRKDLCSIDIPAEITSVQDEVKFEIVYKWLKSPENTTLLVIDNVDKPFTSEEKRILNTVSGSTKIIITSRADLNDFCQYHLRDIDNRSAICLLYRHYLGRDASIDVLEKREDYSIANEIIGDFANNNALLIELISKMAFWENTELSELIAMLRENAMVMESELSIQTAHAESHGLDQEIDINLSLQEQIRRLYQLSGLTEKQREIMSFVTIFPVGTKVYHKVPNWCGFSKEDLQWLLRRGWIKKEADNYLVHPIVKKSVELQNIIDGYKFNVTKYDHLIRELINTEQYLPQYLDYSKYRDRAEIPKFFCNLLESEGYIGKLPFELCSCVSSLFYREGDFISAIRYSFKSLDIINTMYGDENPISADIYDNIGVMFFELYQLEKALEYLKKSLEIKEKIYSDNDLKMAPTYNNLAEVYDKLKEYEKSELYFEKAISVYVEWLGEENLSTANTYDNLANMLNDSRRYEEALMYHKKALAYYEKAYGFDHPEIATAYNNIGLTYHNLGDNTNARIYLEKSLAIRKRILSAKHPHLFITLSILLDVYSALGDEYAYTAANETLLTDFGFMME